MISPRATQVSRRAPPPSARAGRVPCAGGDGDDPNCVGSVARPRKLPKNCAWTRFWRSCTARAARRSATRNSASSSASARSTSIDRSPVTDFRDRALDRSQRPLVLDAAMGTRLVAAGLDLNADDPALWNRTHPELVRAVHRRDIAAGADAILTNTFGANRCWLDRFGAAQIAAELNRAAVALAQAEAGPDRYV